MSSGDIPSAEAIGSAPQLGPSVAGGARNQASSISFRRLFEFDRYLLQREVQPDRCGGAWQDMMAQDPRAAEDGVTGKGNLTRRGENPHAVAAILLGFRRDERGLRIVRLCRDLLHGLRRKAAPSHTTTAS
jgi:hypothetical protein